MPGAAPSQDAHAAAHDRGDQGHHADAHGDDHGHGEALGPIDWQAWGAAVLGIGSGLLVAMVMLIAIGSA